MLKRISKMIATVLQNPYIYISILDRDIIYNKHALSYFTNCWTKSSDWKILAINSSQPHGNRPTAMSRQESSTLYFLKQNQKRAFQRASSPSPHFSCTYFSFSTDLQIPLQLQSNEATHTLPASAFQSQSAREYHNSELKRWNWVHKVDGNS